MLEDIVIDTNVFMHSQNPDCDEFNDSNNLVRTLLEIDTKLCVDLGFKVDETTNKSLIGAEYLSHIMAGSTAFAAILHLASSGRIKEVARSLPDHHRKKIVQMIRKPRDRTFLTVAKNSTESILVSHDYEDFQKPKRKTILKVLGVSVIDAHECLDCI